MVKVWIALGSNVGDRLVHLQQAVTLLVKRVRIEKVSPLYESAPMYVTDQPAFLNGALKAETELSPRELLNLLKDIEAEVGRQTRKRYGPREVDLDLIAYGSLQYRYGYLQKQVLELPHPKTEERRFVLQPLVDLDPSLELPGLGNVSALLEQTCDQAPDLVLREDAVLSL
jgi:2-amino-4-hydroxy-6-hydroxymethyldihydropteridine diphosphokinase